MQVLSVPSNVVMVRNDVVLNFFCLVTWIYDKCTVAQLHTVSSPARHYWVRFACPSVVAGHEG